MVGLKVSDGTGKLARGHTFTPDALPAAIAAPKAEYSAITGLTKNKLKL